MPLEFVGMMDNKPKVFSPEELGDWIAGKVKRNINIKNARDCAAYILQHSGIGGGIGQTLSTGESIFHISHGDKNKRDQGCSVFFVGRNNKHAVIVGIGQHWAAEKNKTNVYKLDWKRGSWNMVNGDIVKL